MSSLLVEHVRDLVGARMVALESSLVDSLGDCPEPLRDAATAVFQSGGKRLRPLLLLLSAELCGYRGDRDVLYGTAVEYVHVASLLHDDVIDEAVLRRGLPTLNQRYGNTMTVLVGDYLCMKAMALAIEAGHGGVLSLISRTTLDLVEGEALQEAGSGRLDLTVDEYLRVVELKTGRLMACASEIPSVLVGDPPGSARRERLREYGLHLGLAFQLADDILDYESDEATLGKPVLSDLREGTVTLPVLHAMAHGGAEARDLFARVVADRDFSRVEPGRIVALVRETGGLAEATRRAQEASARARAALDGFPAGPVLDALVFATEFAVSRTF